MLRETIFTRLTRIPTFYKPPRDRYDTLEIDCRIVGNFNNLRNRDCVK